MKRIYTLIMVVAYATLTYGQSLPAFMDMVYEAPYATEELEIDATDYDLAWEEAEFVGIEKINDGDGTGISAQWAAAWDTSFLYLFFQVEDDIIWTWEDPEWAFWKGDGFQLYLDAMGRREDGVAYGLHGIGLNPGVESQDAIDADKGYTRRLNGMAGWTHLTKQSSEISNSGYILEVAFPWGGIAAGTKAFDNGDGTVDSAMVLTWVEENVKEGLEMSFDAQLNDDDGAGRVNMISWASEPKEPFNNSSTWGGLKLVGGPETNTSSVIENTLSELSIAYQNDRIILQDAMVIKEFKMYDLVGRIVCKKYLNQDYMTINTANYKSGIYIINTINNAGQVSTHKVMVRH